MLTRFYGVSTDLLFGQTDNDAEHRTYEIDQLRLSDAALDVLKDSKFNNRLISEFIAHTNFSQFLSAMEIYIGHKVQSQINTMNAMYKFAEQTIKENTTVPENDEMMAFLQEVTIDEDEYLRYRISERFNMVMKSLFNSHKKDKLESEYQGMLNDMKEQVETFIGTQKTEPINKAKAIVLCK